MNALDIVTHFGMKPHPEGGFYQETYRSSDTIDKSALPMSYAGTRAFSTAILFLLREGEYSHLHRIRQDEVWHFHLGGPLRLTMLSPNGTPSEILLGQNILHDQHLQVVVPGGYWFGATPAPGTEFSLVGCTVAPGFDFADFELGTKKDLEQRFPAASSCINEFCMR